MTDDQKTLEVLEAEMAEELKDMGPGEDAPKENL